MTSSPADILAAARDNPVGPYLTPKDEWLKGWTGPVEFRDALGDWRPAALVRASAFGRWYVAEHDGGYELATERLRLDTRRPEVRHLLCDLGIAPEWARKSAVACWCAGMGVEVENIYRPWQETRWVHYRDPEDGHLRMWVFTTPEDIDTDGHGWALGRPTKATAKGPETGALGRACADLAALHARCILTEPGGYYVPLADGGIGWWAT